MKLTKLALAAAAALLMTGCATNGDIQRLESQIDAVRLEAQTASRSAEQAKTMAASAERKADDANSRARNAEEMLNRGFKKSMYK